MLASIQEKGIEYLGHLNAAKALSSNTFDQVEEELLSALKVLRKLRAAYQLGDMLAKHSNIGTLMMGDNAAKLALTILEDPEYNPNK